MKALVFLGDSRSEVREFPDPKPGSGEVLVRMKVSGVCGSDLKLTHPPWLAMCEGWARTTTVASWKRKILPDADRLCDRPSIRRGASISQ
jgi:NADPH:quinone reductase-like Zn-dependent oxidoreductase